MEYKLYSIYDLVACEYGPLFQCKNDGVAKRNFIELVKNSSVFNVKDYELRCLGSFNVDTGSFDVHVAAPVVVDFSDVVPVEDMEVDK